jgi:hypothetical protein
MLLLLSFITVVGGFVAVFYFTNFLGFTLSVGCCTILLAHAHVPSKNMNLLLSKYNSITESMAVYGFSQEINGQLQRLYIPLNN